ncbi:hypothetical protein [Paenarthrobacter aromaticivorans]|uniref:MmyB family transcriptional regulator n=1 Tax=Paenarthrobacter aromaticivorans TaxID=2849150 RepID=UPI003D169F7D
MRIEAGRNPYDRGLAGLVGELSRRSEDFRVRWRRTTSGSITSARSSSGVRSSGTD